MDPCRCLYHELPPLPRPDLVVAFNAQLSSKSDFWAPTIFQWLESKTAFVFTNDTLPIMPLDEELIQIVAGSSGLRARRHWSGENPWASGRKALDMMLPGWITQDNVGWACFQGV